VNLKQQFCLALLRQRAMVKGGSLSSSVMKRLPTKSQIRASLEQQVEEYLSTGGTVNEIPKGQSGRHDNQNLFAGGFANEPRQERTPLTDVVQTLEARKHPHQADKKSKRPRKKLITDDFGEPLRWVWTEE
jgi:hypothetical protein